MGQRIIGIMGAMPEETNGIVALLQNPVATTRGRRTYTTGTINGISVVVVFSRWGKVAAATTVTHLILEFKITELIFTGVAGAIVADLNIGDIVIGNQFIQHDMDARPLMAKHEIPLLGVTHFESPQDCINAGFVAVNSVIAEKKLRAEIPEADLAQFAIEAPKVIIGVIASGDHFFSDTETKTKLLSELPDVVCVEMEGAAVAQVCYEYAIPYTIIRTISDKAESTSETDFAAFIATIASKYAALILQKLVV